VFTKAHIQVSLPEHVDSNGLAVREVAHNADMLRLRLMRDLGGVYMDADVITVRSFDPLLKVRTCCVGRTQPQSLLTFRSTLPWGKKASAVNMGCAMLFWYPSHNRGLLCDGLRCSTKCLTRAFGACTASSTPCSRLRCGRQTLP